MSKHYKISETELLNLLADSCKLANLECAGVDNWGGYCVSHDYLEEEGYGSYEDQATDLLKQFKTV